MLLIGCFLVALGAGVSRELWPIMPDKLTPVEAARILQMQKGYAGYSLLKEEGGNGQVGHAIFCPTCASEIALVNVSFLPPTDPAPGSRLAILMDLARKATAAEKPKVETRTESKPVEVATR